MTKNTSEIIEASKAAKKVAETTSKALGTVEKFGNYVSKYTSGSFEQISGMFEDKLRYIRWERQERLFLRAQKFLKDEGIDEPNKPMPLKYIVPLLQAASLEDNDQLQDLWAKLLVNFSVVHSSIEATRTYIDILERISPLEAEVINAIYLNPYDAMHHNGVGTQKLPTVADALPDKMNEDARKATEVEPSNEIKLALANLDRLGVLLVGRSMCGWQLFGSINPTLLGKSFYNACTLPSEK